VAGSGKPVEWQASSKSGGWNEHFERLEGTLFGYEDWQNDWWIDLGLRGGGFGGLRLCCPITAAGLAWIETAGFRALPPVESATLTIANYDVDAEARVHALLVKKPDHAAVVRFNVLGRHIMELADLRDGGPWHFPGGPNPRTEQKPARIGQDRRTPRRSWSIGQAISSRIVRTTGRAQRSPSCSGDDEFRRALPESLREVTPRTRKACHRSRPHGKDHRVRRKARDCHVFGVLQVA
jgi:hypothetical protein